MVVGSGVTGLWNSSGPAWVRHPSKHEHNLAIFPNPPPRGGGKHSPPTWGCEDSPLLRASPREALRRQEGEPAPGGFCHK